MRINANKLRPEDRGRYQVWVDGKRAERVIEADDIVGYIITPMLDADGKLMVNRLYETICTKCVFGEVTIIDTRQLPVPVSRWSARDVCRAFGLADWFIELMMEPGFRINPVAALLGNRRGKSWLRVGVDRGSRLGGDSLGMVIMDEPHVVEIKSFVQALDARVVLAPTGRDFTLLPQGQRRKGRVKPWGALK